MHPGCPIEQVYLCREPVDFRKSIDGLSVLVEQEFGLNPFAQVMYVFMNRQRTKIKVLYWHRNGFFLWMKRLEKDRFAWFNVRNTDAQTTLNNPTQNISLQEFEWLLEGFDIWKIKPHKALDYSRVS